MEDKVERYDWEKLGEKGEYRMIDIDEINVDPRYQRGEVSDINTLHTAREFDWAAFGTCTIARRRNGSLWAMDGQQRILSAKRRGDIKKVPCLVFDSEGLKWEAERFLKIQTSRARVPTILRFRDSVLACRSPEKEIDEFLTSIGVRVGNAGGGQVMVIAFPDRLIGHWKVAENAARAAVLAQVEIAGASHCLSVNVHNGIVYLVRCGVDVGQHTAKLISMGGIDRIEGAIRAYALESGASKSERVCAVGLLSIINHRSRKRIALPEAIPDAGHRARP